MFGNPLGLYALGSLILLLILYLRRPKPLTKVIPSLMFLIKEKGEEKRYSMFKKLINNILFFLQFLALAALAFAVAQPIVNLTYDTNARNTVLVIDTSASMQTEDGFSTRLDKAVDAASKRLSGKVSIVGATIVPTVLLTEGSKGEAKSILKALSPTDLPTNVEGAMFQAEALLSGETGKIIVVSDFVVDDSSDQPIKAKVVLESKGHTVELIDVSNEAENVGITSLDITKDRVKVFIKNFKDETVSANVDLIQGTAIESKEVTIPAESLEVLDFPVLTGTSTIELNHNDDLNADNTAYISAPLRKKTNVVMITSLKEGQSELRSLQGEYIDFNFIVRALTSLSGVQLHIVRPPRMVITTDEVNAIDLNPSVVIFHKVNKEELISHGLTDYVKLVEAGASFITTAQEDLSQLDLEGLLPINPSSTGDSTQVCVDIINFYTQRFEGNPCFTTAEKYVIAKPNNGTVVIASARDDSPLLALGERGKGKLFYYGILDDYSSFKANENYPIFWSNLIDFLTEAEDIQAYNRKFIDEGMFVLETSGFHELEGRTVAVNLLSEHESNINKQPDSFSVENAGGFLGKIKAPFQLALPLALFGLFLVIFEIVVVKVRGDL